MSGGQTYTLTVRFVRALAYLSQEAIDRMITEVDARTQNKYAQELIVQAISMAPQCKIEQAINNLVHNSARVFESIL